MTGGVVEGTGMKCLFETMLFHFGFFLAYKDGAGIDAVMCDHPGRRALQKGVVEILQ